MASSDGIIRRKQVIEDDALNWGPEYAKQTQIAIDKNKEVVQGIVQIASILKQIKDATGNSAYTAALQQGILATQKTILSLKEQEAAEISLNRVRISSIALSEAERKAKLAIENAESKLQKSKDALIKKTAQEIYDQSVLTRNAKNLAIINSKLSTEYEKLTAKKRLAATALQNLIIAGKKADETTDQYNARLRKAQAEFDALHKKVVAANRAVSIFNDNVGNYPKNAAKGLRDLVEAFGLVVGIQTFVDIAKQAFDIIRNFEAEIVNLAAIAGKSRADIAPLEADIREVAKASINSATEVAKLATELIKLGSTPEEVSKLLKPVNDLSIALQASAEDSATLVKSLLNAYQEGAEKATHFTDVLAESANRSALDFAGLRDSFSYIAPVSNTLGISVEKTAAIIGTLTDNGIKAESAGRLMATGLGKLAKQGLTLEAALAKITTAQKQNKSSMEVLNIANKLFGGEAGKLALILANNTKKIEESTLAYQNSNGALAELTDKQLKSLNSELEILSSAWEEYILDNNEAIGGTKVMTSVLSFLSSNLKEIIDLLVFSGTIWLAYRSSLILATVQAKLMALTTVENTVATAASTVATTASTVATDVNTAALLFHLEGLEANASAQLTNATATNTATTATQKFNAALKANMLSIILVALIAVIYYYNKLTKSFEQNYEELKKSTSEFLKNKAVTDKNAKSINDLSDRYDVLKAKTKLSTEEQKELNKIIEILAKTVPGATSKMDKYGNAIAINTAKTREYVEARNEMFKAENAVKLDKNIALLKDLRKEQDYLNVSSDKNNGSLVEGIGYVVKMDGVLKKRGNTFQGYIDLTKEDIALYARKRFQNEEAIANTIAHINALRGLTDEQKKAIALRDKEAKDTADNGPRTIAIIDAEIKAQEDLIATLSDKTGKEGNVIKAKIKALNAERDLIYNNNKGQEKDNEKQIRKQLEQMKRIRDAIYNLNQFRLQNAIDINQQILDDEKTSSELKLNAYIENEQLRKEKNDETLQYELFNNALEGKELEKLTEKKRKLFFQSSKDRVEAIIAGKIATEEMTKSELLILEKHNAEKKRLEYQGAKDRQKIIDGEVDRVKKRIDDEILKKETQINKAIEAENNMFNEINKAENQSRKEREIAIEAHERKIYEIRKSFALDALKVQIDGLQKELDKEASRVDGAKVSADVLKKVEFDLQKAKTDYSDLSYEQYLDLNKDKIEQEKYTAEKILEVSNELTNSLSNLTNAIFDAKIQNIEYEQKKNDEYYAKQIELAGKDERQKDILQKERDKKNDLLEKKKRKEQEKQAIFNKALTVAQIGLQTALAIITAAAATAPTFWGVAIAATIGAVELGAALATPIPKYKDGRKGGPKEVAMINDGGVTEIVESKDGSARVYSGKNRIVQLLEGDTVHKSFDDYNKLQRAAMLASLNMEGRNMSDFQASQYFEASYGKELLEEMKLTRKAIQNQKQPVYHGPKIDIPHAIWKSKNTNWN